MDRPLRYFHSIGYIGNSNLFVSHAFVFSFSSCYVFLLCVKIHVRCGLQFIGCKNHSHRRLYLLTLEPPCGYSECTRSTNSWGHSKTLLKGLASVPGTRRGSCSGIGIDWRVIIGFQSITYESIVTFFWLC
jgi:hypothetical protein